MGCTSTPSLDVFFNLQLKILQKMIHYVWGNCLSAYHAHSISVKPICQLVEQVKMAQIQNQVFQVDKSFTNVSLNETFSSHQDQLLFN